MFLFDGGALGMIPTSFDFKAKVKKDGRVSGEFRQTLTVLGSLIDVIGDVTCVTFDHANGRAWIGPPSSGSRRSMLRRGTWFSPGPWASPIIATA